MSARIQLFIYALQYLNRYNINVVLHDILFYRNNFQFNIFLKNKKSINRIDINKLFCMLTYDCIEQSKYTTQHAIKMHKRQLRSLGTLKGFIFLQFFSRLLFCLIFFLPILFFPSRFFSFFYILISI